MKFKVGDKVRCKANGIYRGINKGDILTIEDIHSEYGDAVTFIEMESFDGVNGLYGGVERNFTLHHDLQLNNPNNILNLHDLD